MSWWRSIDDVIGFARADYRRARYYPDDERFLLTRLEEVEHLVVMGSYIDFGGPGPR